MLAASEMLVDTRAVLVGLILVALATMVVVISLKVEMIEEGSVVNSPFIGIEVACALVVTVSSLAVFVFVPFDFVGAGASDPMTSVPVSTSAVIDEEVCCGMSGLVADGITATSEVDGDDISLVDPMGSTMLDTAETIVGDTCASLVGDAYSLVDAMDEDTLEDSASSDCCDSIPVSIVVVVGAVCVDSSDCCDSMPVSMALVTVGSSDTLEAESVDCAGMTRDGS